MSAHNPLRGVREAVHNAARDVHSRTLLIVIVALALVVAGLAYLRLPGPERPQGQAQQRDVAPAVSTMFDRNPTLLVVGDSYASGKNDSKVVTYPYLVAASMHWSLALDAQDGTGFVRSVDNVSPPRVPFIDRLDRDAVTYHVDYVLIDGGRNDLDEPPDRVVAAADNYVKKVRSVWPNAKIIIMLPSDATADVAPNYPGVADGLRRTAEGVGAAVIDPVAQRWYRGNDVKPARWHDGAYLNSDGQKYYANMVLENLKQLVDQRPMLLVVGDSFAGGTGDSKFVTFPYLLANRMDCGLAIDAQGGTGFFHGVYSVSPPHVPFIERLDRDAAIYRVDYVLVDGGRNDLGEPPDKVVPAADEYIKKVRSVWPAAKIIILLPSYASPVDAENFPAVAEALRGTAQSVGAYVIDPVAQRWYRDRDVKPLLWHDGIHLNGEGNTYYADRIVDNLKQMGLVS